MTEFNTDERRFFMIRYDEECGSAQIIENQRQSALNFFLAPSHPCLSVFIRGVS
jgi:hypothetical protein